MSLDIGPALSRGVEKLTTAAGLQLAAVYFLVALLTTLSANALVVGLVPEASSQVGLALPMSPGVAGALVVVGLVLNLILTVVVLRSMTHDPAELGSIPAGVTADIAPTVVFLFVANVIVGVLVVIGFVLLIVPGIFLLVSLIFTQVYVAVEGEGPIEALSSSWSLASGDRLALFLLGLVVVAVGFLTGLVGSAVGVVSQPAGTVVSTLVSAAVFIFNNAVLIDAWEQLRTAQAETVGALGPDDLDEGANQNR